jgi:hypothetical protein
VNLPEVLPDDEQLRSWDWRAALKAEERTMPWLARRTDRAQRTVYAYAYGQLRPPIEWLRAAYAVIVRDRGE